MYSEKYCVAAVNNVENKLAEKASVGPLQAIEEAAAALQQYQEEAAELRHDDQADQQLQNAILQQLWKSMQSH